LEKRSRFCPSLTGTILFYISCAYTQVCTTERSYKLRWRFINFLPVIFHILASQIARNKAVSHQLKMDISMRMSVGSYFIY
jgi:hypothetical protein